MPQSVHVVKCCSCEVFQVDIIKKDKKWTCKLCDERQTLRQVFGRGSGPECRAHVQKLNLDRMKITASRTTEAIPNAILSLDTEIPRFVELQTNIVASEEPTYEATRKTKWDRFVEYDSDEELGNVKKQSRPIANVETGETKIEKAKQQNMSDIPANTTHKENLNTISMWTKYTDYSE